MPKFPERTNISHRRLHGGHSHSGQTPAGTARFPCAGRCSRFPWPGHLVIREEVTTAGSGGGVSRLRRPDMRDESRPDDLVSAAGFVPGRSLRKKAQAFTSQQLHEFHVLRVTVIAGQAISQHVIRLIGTLRSKLLVAKIKIAREMITPGHCYLKSRANDSF
jgi:hypothetical protein